MSAQPSTAPALSRAFRPLTSLIPLIYVTGMGLAQIEARMDMLIEEYARLDVLHRLVLDSAMHSVVCDGHPTQKGTPA